MMNLDAERLLEYMDAHGIDGGQQITRGWHHIGALITDSVLQRRQKYKATVYPRVQALVEEWPDAATTSGFRARINQGGLSDIIRWNGQQRLQQIEDMVAVFDALEIEDVETLHKRLQPGPKRDEFRTVLRKVRHVGPKTVDYMDILAGVETGTAVDSRIKKHMKSAGVSNLTYSHVQGVMRKAADLRKWRHGDLDAALWNAA